MPFEPKYVHLHVCRAKCLDFRFSRLRCGDFVEDRAGGVSILFGLMAVTLLMCIGSAVDLSRWLSARTSTMSAVDSAVLAGARSLQVNSGDAEAALEVASHYYMQNTRDRLDVRDEITFVLANNNTAVAARGSSFIKTPFLSFAGIPELPLIREASAEGKIAVGGNSGGSIEVSMMLDVTGSMAGDKIADLQLAAKDLIDIVVWDDQSEFTSRVALVPFAEAVRVNDNWASVVMPDASSSLNFTDRRGYSKRYYRDASCFTERVGSDAFTDAAPTGLSKLSPFYDSDGKCQPRLASVIPLTSDTATLKNAIDGFQASGTTAGHLGTAWAWYMLSPNWASSLPSQSRPGDYSLLTQIGPKGQPQLRKIAILMTDGEYNTQYCKGVSDSVINCNAPNGNSTQQARALCQNMKATGITVYTVGFQLPANGQSVDTLRQCASDPDKFFSAENGDQLKQAFREIALRISALYLAN